MLTDTGIVAPSFVFNPGPIAITSPSLALEIVDSGSNIPPAVYIIFHHVISRHISEKLKENIRCIKYTFVTGRTLLIRTRSAKGIIFLKDD
jgi:hypothetical protein